MSEDKKNELMNELKSLPKPELQKQVQDQMFQEIQRFSTKYDKNQWWGNFMKKLFAGIGTVTVIVTLSFVTYHAIKSDDISTRNNQNASQIDEEKKGESNLSNNRINEALDPIDLKLGPHQVAIGDLYFEIPIKKETVYIDRRIEGEYTMVDIRDKETNELLYRYGKSKSNNKEKQVFREVQTTKAKVRIQAFIEFNTSNHKIESVKHSNVSITQNKIPFQEGFTSGLSKSGKFPAEKIEVVAHGSFQSETEYEEFHEGFVVGGINVR